MKKIPKKTEKKKAKKTKKIITKRTDVQIWDIGR